jgi:subtilisin family serine protease
MTSIDRLAAVFGLSLLLSCQFAYPQSELVGGHHHGDVEGLHSPNRASNNIFVVILEKSSIPSTENPIFTQRRPPGPPSENLRAAHQTVASEVEQRAQSLLSRVPARIVQTLSGAAPGFIAEMSDEAAKTIAADPTVHAVIADEVLPNVTLTTQAPAPSWGLDRLDQRSLPLDHSYGYLLSGSGVHAYVVDSGIRVSHQDFQGRASLDVGFVSDVPPLGGDCLGHGTQVASIIGGGTYGVAKAVKLHSVRIIDCKGDSNIAWIVNALDWLDHNVYPPAVVNISSKWCDFGDPTRTDFVNQTFAQLNRLSRSGVIVVIAAGNDGPSADAANGWPAHYSGLQKGIIVSASTQSDGIWSGATLGTVDLFAPGDLVTTAWKDNDTATMSQMSGTSLAAPHVAGVIALMFERNPMLCQCDFWSAGFDSTNLFSTPNVIQGNLHGAVNRLISSLVAGNVGPNGGAPPPGPTRAQVNAVLTVIESELQLKQP